MSIESAAHKLIALRTRSQELLHTGNMEAWLANLPEKIRAAEELRCHLLQHAVVVTDDPEVRALFEEIEIGEADDPDKTCSDLLFSMISPAEYGAALAEVRVLAAPFSIPWNLQAFIEEARQCYALGQYAAVQSLSRTILEAAVNDIAVRTRKMPEEVIEQDMFQQYPPKKRIRLVAGKEFDPIYEHYRDLCKVIHGLSISASTGPLRALTKTLGFIDYLYQSHKVTIKTNEGEQGVAPNA